MDKQIIMEELSGVERWVIETMVRQMDLLVEQMCDYPVCDTSYSNAWFDIKEKLGLGDIS